MSTFAVAENLAQALAPGAPRARSAKAAERLAGARVVLVCEPAPASYPTPAEAAAAGAGPDGLSLYDRGGELIHQDGGWRIVWRYWRPAPPYPVARTARNALKAPLGFAATEADAAVLLGGPADLRREIAPWRYRTRARLMARWGGLIDRGLAEIVVGEAHLHLAVVFWAPFEAKPRFRLSPAERSFLQARIAAPMRGLGPQSPLDIGLFEHRAPENAAVVLAEEGDGRRPQE